MIMVQAGGASIPALGLGTWDARGDECARAVEHALRVGYTHIDTAAMYDNETAVGEGLRASGVARDDFWLTTKVWYTDIGDGDLQRSAEASLKRLGVDQTDLFLIHWPNAEIPLEQSIRALNQVKNDGLARHIGISNFTVEQVDRAVALSDAPLVANQCEYHPFLDQSELIATCRRNDIAFTSYCPIARGGELFATAAVSDAAAAYGKTPAQIVLRWHVQQDGVIAIPKSSNPARIEENLNIFDFALSATEMTAISDLARTGGRLVNPGWSPAWDTAA